VSLRVVTWNLRHGRADPPAGRYLLDEFAAALAGWEWDAALLQEVPPWWPLLLARRTDAEARTVLSSRNALLAARRAVAIRRPDLIKSNGGGANAILVRGKVVVDHRTVQLCRLPERRWLHAVRTRGGLWLGNLHSSTNPASARRDADRAAGAMLAWADGAPAVLGGDFNLRSLSLPCFTTVASHNVDHVFVVSGAPDGPAEVLDRGTLSDHAPVAATVTLTAG
jgi:endonuclease/exonuclease/phosphatase family metal-dependent hydrolase